jgi:hypothetical protein
MSRPPSVIPFTLALLVSASAADAALKTLPRRSFRLAPADHRGAADDRDRTPSLQHQPSHRPDLRRDRDRARLLVIHVGGKSGRSVAGQFLHRRPGSR